MRMKRTWALVAAIVMSMSLALGGTIAYLSDTDSDVNVMTLGKVEIVQNEQMRDPLTGGLTEYKDKPAMPAVYTTEAWADEKVTISGEEYKFFAPEMKNVNDKIVTVTNTGKSDAYVRTIIAIEAPQGFNDDLLHLNVNNVKGVTQSAWDYATTADGERYVYSIFTYTDKLAPKATTQPSLMQVFLDKKTDNEDIALLGDEMEIIALSQAVQAEGFADAATALAEAFPFGTDKNATVAGWLAAIDSDDIGSPGDKNDTNNPPVYGTEVDTLEELMEAFAEGGTVILTDDIDVDKAIVLAENTDVVLNMNGKTLTPTAAADPLFNIPDSSTLTVTGNGTVDLGDNYALSIFLPYGGVIIENGTFIRKGGGEYTDYGGMFVGIKNHPNSSVVIKGGYFDGGYYNADAKEFVETEADKINRGQPADANKYRTAIKQNIIKLVNLSWGDQVGTQDFRIYGGTFVGANPAWGDEGCALPTTPDYLRPWSYYQGTFLDGQQVYDDRIELPAGYSIDEGKLDDGRPTYTVNYSK